MICDTHIHIYDHRYPVTPTAVVHADDASVGEYVSTFPSRRRVVVVQPSAYGLDNRCQLAALSDFERAGVAARGVMVIDAATPVSEIERLQGLGVSGARFHMLPGGAVPWSHLDAVAQRIAPFGWHVQLQLNGRELPDRLEDLLRLPTALVVDHVGRFMPPVDVHDPAFLALLQLVDEGRTWVKLSAPYESSADIGLVEPLAAALMERVPERMLWASNWPHPGHSRATSAWVPAGLSADAVDANAAELYGF